MGKKAGATSPRFKPPAPAPLAGWAEQALSGGTGMIRSTDRRDADISVNSLMRVEEMPGGVRLHVRKLTAWNMARLRRRAARDAARFVEGWPDAPAGTKAAELAFAQALARAAIVGWDGVADTNGDAADVNADATDALMCHFGMPAAFVAAMERACAGGRGPAEGATVPAAAAAPSMERSARRV